MTWSNEYRESIRKHNLLKEIDDAEIRSYDTVSKLAFVVILIQLVNMTVIGGQVERLDKIEQTLEIKKTNHDWWILEEIFGDKK